MNILHVKYTKSKHWENEPRSDVTAKECVGSWKWTETAPHPGLGLIHSSTFWFCSGVKAMLETVGENSAGRAGEITSSFLTCSLSLFILLYLSTLFLISLWWFLGNIVWVPPYLLWPNYNLTADKLLFFLCIHFHHCKARKLVLVFLLPHKNLRRRKEKVHGMF